MGSFFGASRVYKSARKGVRKEKKGLFWTNPRERIDRREKKRKKNLSHRVLALRPWKGYQGKREGRSFTVAQ